MTKREYEKYNFTAEDAYGEEIEAGDYVIINNYYNHKNLLGIVTHYIATTNRLAIATKYSEKGYYYMSYRHPYNLVKVKGKKFDDALRNTKKMLKENGRKRN